MSTTNNGTTTETNNGTTTESRIPKEPETVREVYCERGYKGKCSIKKIASDGVYTVKLEGNTPRDKAERDALILASAKITVSSPKRVIDGDTITGSKTMLPADVLLLLSRKS